MVPSSFGTCIEACSGDNEFIGDMKCVGVFLSIFRVINQMNS